MSDTATLAPKTYGFLLDGQWISEGERFEVRSPYDGRVVAAVHRPQARHIETAVAAAVQAFDTTRRMPAYERQHILRAIAESVAARREEFARTIALEAGKPVRTARFEVDRAVFTWNIAAEEATRIYGEWLPLDAQASRRVGANSAYLWPGPRCASRLTYRRLRLDARLYPQKSQRRCCRWRR